MNSNTSQNNNNSNNKNSKKEFFHLTGHQLSANINHYEKALNQPQVTIFNQKQLEEIKEEKQEKLALKRLNAIDSTMLEENAYRVIDNPSLKLEKKIENYEKALWEINEKIEVAETINDTKTHKELLYKKNILEENITKLQTQYKNQNLENELTDFFTNILLIPKKLKYRIKDLTKKIIKNSKFLGKYTPFARAIMIRETINKLNKINNSVDELVKMKVPFGEQEEKYNTLVNHLQRAGSLHAKILKELEE